MADHHDVGDRGLDVQVRGVEQACGLGIDHFDCDGGQGEGGEGEEHAGRGAGERLRQSLPAAVAAGSI
ncbi:hypothetical protein [Streptomyces formicae]|uniref:hypothetical protein n=1 Tax=Streptomyces formicae TaxID=1616117 RepID=UPI003BB58B14